MADKDYLERRTAAQKVIAKQRQAASEKARQAVMKRRERRNQIEALVLSGMHNRHTIAKNVGCGIQTVYRDLGIIQKRWIHSDEESQLYRRSQRLNQLGAIMMKAATGYAKSGLDAEITRTRVYFDKDGRQRTDTTVEKKGQSGDAAFLNVMVKCVTEAAKIDGLMVDRQHSTSEVKIDVQMTHSDEVMDSIRQMPTREIIDVIRAVRHAAMEYRAATVESGDGHSGNGNGQQRIEGN